MELALLKLAHKEVVWEGPAKLSLQPLFELTMLATQTSKSMGIQWRLRS